MTSRVRKILLCQYEKALGFADRKPWIMSIENQVEAKDLFKRKNKKNFLLYETTALPLFSIKSMFISKPAYHMPKS